MMEAFIIVSIFVVCTTVFLFILLFHIDTCKYRAERKIKKERCEIRRKIRNAVNLNRYEIDCIIIYPENVDWVKKMGFQIETCEDSNRYLISWEDCLYD